MEHLEHTVVSENFSAPSAWAEPEVKYKLKAKPARASIKMCMIIQEKEVLAREVEHLNNTVFSKNFKAPSAWAEREVKYKMEKRDWDAEKKKLRDLLQKLESENAAYRASNKTAEFETQIQVRTTSANPADSILSSILDSFVQSTPQISLICSWEPYWRPCNNSGFIWEAGCMQRGDQCNAKTGPCVPLQ